MNRLGMITEGAALWCAYYRANPHRFAADYLHLDLRLFQKILLLMMNINTVFVFIASRGIGKSFLSAVYCVIRCILYPGTKICIASGNRGQAANVLEKINLELKPNSPELALEIDEKQSRMTNASAQIVFKNGSYIKVVTASDSARSNRANVLLLDEFRLISKDTIDTVLRKFLTQKRMPKYAGLTKEERKLEHRKEKNMTMYLSSAYWADHWSYEKCKDVFNAMMKGGRQFICGLPYQLPVYEGLIDEENILEELSESGFSQVKFDMEYSALWYGGNDGTFFDFNSIAKNRKIKYPMLPSKYSALLNGDKNIRIPPKQVGEIRILSADIALMSSTRHNNDATAIFINQMMPTKANRYINNIVYTETNEGMHTVDQALLIRRLFDEFACDYLVIDAQGAGAGVVDLLFRDINDPDTGEIYPALSCCNNPEMAARCTSPDAEKVIYTIKASAQFNSDCAFLLREAFRSGRIRLIAPYDDADSFLDEIKGYSSMTASDKEVIKQSYLFTDLLTVELTNLQYEETGPRVKLIEKSNMRKDRYSSLSYNYYVATELDAKLGKKSRNATSTESFVIKAPKYNNGKAVSGIYGRRSNHSWR